MKKSELLFIAVIIILWTYVVVSTPTYIPSRCYEMGTPDMICFHEHPAALRYSIFGMFEGTCYESCTRGFAGCGYPDLMGVAIFTTMLGCLYVIHKIKYDKEMTI